MEARHAGAATAAFDELPDDTEESVMGTMLHQEAIRILTHMLQTLRDQEGAGWDVSSQIAIAGFRKRDGTAYAPMPDVFVHCRRVPQTVTEISLAEYGPPVLAVEVASPSTIRFDVGEKAAAYARGGVREYLVFDVGGDLLGAEGPVWARRLAPESGGTLEPWRPEDDGRWHSRLGFSVAPAGLLLRLYTRHGTPLATPRELEQRLREAEQRAAALEAELRRLRAARD